MGSKVFKGQLTKKKWEELIFIQMIPQVHVKTRKQKVTKDKERIQKKSTDNKEKRTGR